MCSETEPQAMRGNRAGARLAKIAAEQGSHQVDKNRVGNWLHNKNGHRHKLHSSRCLAATVALSGCGCSRRAVATMPAKQSAWRLPSNRHSQQVGGRF